MVAQTDDGHRLRLDDRLLCQSCSSGCVRYAGTSQRKHQQTMEEIKSLSGPAVGASAQAKVAAAATAHAKARRADLPWVEKYRPQKLAGATFWVVSSSQRMCGADLIGNRETVERLCAIAASGNVPNLILSGSSGCGKTTSVLCLARELLGDQHDEAVLEINASDDRCVSVSGAGLVQWLACGLDADELGCLDWIDGWRLNSVCWMMATARNVCGCVYSKVEVMRTRVKEFAQRQLRLPPHRHKMVILDEADKFSALAVAVLVC